MSAVTVLYQGKPHRGLHNHKGGFVAVSIAGQVVAVPASEIVRNAGESPDRLVCRAVQNGQLTIGNATGVYGNATGVYGNARNPITGQVQTKAQRAELLPSILRKKAF